MSEKEMAPIVGEVLPTEVAGLAHKEMTPAMQAAIQRIDTLFTGLQQTSIRAFWSVGCLITEVRDNPDKYLTKEQQTAHVNGEAIIVSIFAPVYSAEQLRSAVTMFERYPSESELARLLSLRCPERPRWRLTASHVQLLSQIPDDTQRAKIEELCDEEAYTAKALAQELQELRGDKKAADCRGRPHEAPKGLKQQLQDLLAHQRRFLTRSEKLWLNEKDDNIYDDLANTSPTKLDDTICGYFREIERNFNQLSDQVADHLAMCRKTRSQVFDPLEKLATAEEREDDDLTSGPSVPKPRSPMTR